MVKKKPISQCTEKSSATAGLGFSFGNNADMKRLGSRHMRELGRENRSQSGASAAVNALSDHCRGGVRVCPERNLKGWRGLLCEASQLPDHDRGSIL